MAAQNGREQIIFEFQGFTNPGQQEALRFLLDKMGRHEDNRTLWDNFARTEKKYPATAKMFRSGKTYALQGEFNDAREDLAFEMGDGRFDQEALRTLLTRMGPQLDVNKAWWEFKNGDKKFPQLYYNLYTPGDLRFISWHNFESNYSERIKRGESIYDLVNEHRRSRVKLGNWEETSQGNAEGMYATARIEAALRMTKGDTKKAVSFLASMGKKG
jgi:hypothetical protein